MNRSSKMQLRQLIIALCFFGLANASFAQKQSKTFKESFNVGADAVLDINTSYADIEFETWDKDVVEINATVTLEGASDEEAEAFPMVKEEKPEEKEHWHRWIERRPIQMLVLSLVVVKSMIF